MTTALAALVDGETPIATVVFVVGRFHIAAEIGAVDFHLAGSLHGLDLGRERFADFVGEDERRLVLAIEVARELKGAMALRAVDENGDRQEIVANRELAAGEDRAGGHAVLVSAGFALEQRARLVSVGGDAAAVRAHRLAVGRGPADLTESLARLLFGHARDLR